MQYILIALAILIIILFFSFIMYEKTEEKGEKSKWLVTSVLVSVLTAITYLFYTKKKKEGNH